MAASHGTKTKNPSFVLYRAMLDYPLSEMAGSFDK